MKKFLKILGGERFQKCMYSMYFFFWNSPLLNGLPFNKLRNANQGKLQLGDIAYFSNFSKLGEKKCLIR